MFTFINRRNFSGKVDALLVIIEKQLSNIILNKKIILYVMSFLFQKYDYYINKHTRNIYKYIFLKTFIPFF